MLSLLFRIVIALQTLAVQRLVSGMLAVEWQAKVALGLVKGSDHSWCCGAVRPSVYLLTSWVPASNFASSWGIF